MKKDTKTQESNCVFVWLRRSTINGLKARQPERQPQRSMIIPRLKLSIERRLSIESWLASFYSTRLNQSARPSAQRTRVDSKSNQTTVLKELQQREQTKNRLRAATSSFGNKQLTTGGCLWPMTKANGKNMANRQQDSTQIRSPS